MTCHKVAYRTVESAETQRQQLIADDKVTGRAGRSWKRLCVYSCTQCRGAWHIGRENHSTRKPVRKPDARKALLRQLKRLEREWADHDMRMQRRILGRLQAQVDEDKETIRLQAQMLIEQRDVLAALGVVK